MAMDYTWRMREAGKQVWLRSFLFWNIASQRSLCPQRYWDFTKCVFTSVLFSVLFFCSSMLLWYKEDHKSAIYKKYMFPFKTTFFIKLSFISFLMFLFSGFSFFLLSSQTKYSKLYQILYFVSLLKLKTLGLTWQGKNLNVILKLLLGEKISGNPMFDLYTIQSSLSTKPWLTIWTAIFITSAF